MPNEVPQSAYANYLDSQKVANAKNVAILSEIFSRAGITSIVMTFDGEGDDGQLQEMNIEPSEANIPPDKITIICANYHSTQLSEIELTVEEALDELCYRLLDQDNDGWENGDGACGEFRFDVAAGSVSLDFNSRFTDFEHSEYSYGNSPEPQPIEGASVSGLANKIGRPDSAASTFVPT